MSKKKRSKKNAALSLTPEQEKELAALLHSYKNADAREFAKRISSPQLARAFIENLSPEPGLSQLIVAISEAFADKQVQKAIRKLLFKLKTRGLETPQISKADEATPIIRPVAQESPEAFLGSYDAAGTRGVMVALPRFPRGFDVAMGVISEEHGILEFFYGAYSKKGLREVRETLLQSEDMVMVKTTLSHAATALEKAYSANEDATAQGPRAYAEFRPTLLAKTELLETSPIHDHITESEIDAITITRDTLERLFGHHLMKFFVINHEKLPDLLDEISKLDDSPIYLTEEQKAQRQKEIEKRWLTENITHERREILKYRLEEMAYVLWNKEEQELAKIATAAAQMIPKENSNVLDYLFSRTLSLALGEPEDTDKDTEKSPDSLIISP